MSKTFVITKPHKGMFLDETNLIPRQGQMVCRPLSVGLCGTDRLIFNGEMPVVKYPRVPCHEVAAVVVTDNSSMALVSGTAVCVNPYNSCGKCHACVSGRLNCCKANQTLGVQRDGVLREQFIVDADHVHVLPSHVDHRLFCLAEPLALALHIVQRAGDVKGKKCLVAGAGNVGKLVIHVLSLMGAKVIAWDISPVRLQEAQKMGARILVDASRPEAEQHLFDITDGEGVSVSFETSGESSVFEVCIRVTAFGGKVVVVGHSKQVSGIRGSDIVFKELDVIGSRNSLGQFSRAIAMIAADENRWRESISHRFSFDHSLEAFQLVAGKTVPYSKIVIDFA